MNRIVPTDPNSRGEAVADLHTGLRKLLARGEVRFAEIDRNLMVLQLEAESANRTFGSVTRRIVVAFQRANQLEPSGVVDQRTADLLNELLGVDDAPVQQQHVVAGAVRTAEGQPAVGRTVRASHVDERGAVLLGEATTDGEGRYTIRYDPLPGVTALRLRVSVAGEDGKSVRDVDAPATAGAMARIDVTLPSATAAANEARIEGRVVLDYGEAAENIPVRLYRRDFGGGATLLEEKTTLEHGVYAFAYQRDQAAGLEIRTVDATGKEVPLSRTLFPDETRTVLNVVAPAQVKPLAAEYARLSADVTQQIGGMEKLAVAREGGDQRDLTTLNRATGWDARLLSLASTAAKLSADPDVRLPQETLYALMRVGLPADKEQLAQASPETVRRALTTARDKGIVDMTNDQIGAAANDFARAATTITLKGAAPGSTSTYQRLFDSSGVNDASLGKFAPVFLEHRGEGAVLWQKAKEAGVPDADIRKLQTHGKLAFLTTNSAPLIEKLREAGVDDPSKLVEQDFHRAGTWKAQVQALAANEQELAALIPSVYAGQTIAERIDAYADDMARKVRLSYPTQVVSRMIATDDADTMGLGNTREGARKFLDATSEKGFKLGVTPVETFTRQHPEVLAEAGDVAETRQTMKTLQRVYQMTPSDESMQTLMRLGFTSAAQVAALPRHIFLDRYSGEFPSKYEATLVYDKAVQIDAVTYNLFSIARQMDNTPATNATAPSPAAKEDAKEALVKEFPTMESLFGSMDFCECEHCQSVLSPAAYLVDLLQFIDQDTLTWNNFLSEWKKTHNNEEYTAKYKKPYDALMARRPDIVNIPLTCENTHTVLPYIDVVNEILEYYVAHNQLAANAAHDPGGATSAELLAEPQHVISKAYETLLEARYPLSLPFDLWLETVRAFTNYFEVPLWRVLDVFRPGDELFAPSRIYDRAAVYNEMLGLSPAEYGLLTDPDALATWFRLYGFNNANAATQKAADASGQRIDLNSAKALSRRLGVTYKELIALIETNFINPRLQTLAVLRKSGLTVKDALFHEANKALAAQPEAGLTPEQKAKRSEVLAFQARLDETTAAHPGFNARQWFTDTVAEGGLDDILILADPDAGCNFDLTELRYADGEAADGIAFLRINLFVRLWRKLGWTIEETDRALTALIPRDIPFDAAHVAQSPLKMALLYLAHLRQLEQTVNAGKGARIKLLTFWSDIDTTSKNSLYAQMFLTRSMLKADPAFDHPRGLYLTQAGVFVKDHLPALRAALGVTADEIALILPRGAAGQTLDNAALSMANVSLLYRYQLLAKVLKLSIKDLLALIEISGLDPFKRLPVGAINAVEEDIPLSNTLCFVEIAQRLKEAGFTVEDLDYLLRHRFDPNGRYALVANGTVPLLKTLADGIRAVRTEHAVPDDPGGMSDDALRQKLGLVLPADVVERFLSMLNGSVELTATRSGVVAADKLDPAAFVGHPAIRQVRYNPARNEQSLTFRGVLFDPQRVELEASFPSPVFAALLADVRAQAQAFFAKYLRKQPPNVKPESGFLEAADYDLLFAPPPAPPPGADEQTKQRLAQEHVRNQKSRLAQAFLPFLQRQMIRTFVVQTLAAANAADAALTETVITEKQIGGSPAPLIEAFTAVHARGVTATFFASQDATGAALGSMIVADANTNAPNRPAGANSTRIEGYVQVPVAGAYRFFASLDKANAEAELRFDHLTAPLLSGVAASDNAELSEFVELKAGVPYRFTLLFRKLGGGNARLLVQGETLPKDGLSRLTLYAESAFDRAHRAALLLNKILRVVATLTLNERELRYLTAHVADFDGLDLSRLPANDTINDAVVASLLAQLLRLAAYKRLRADLTGGTDALIGVFEASAIDTTLAYPLLASLTRRTDAQIRETAERLFAAPRFVSEIDLQRLWEALQIVERFGVPLLSIAGVRGAQPAAATGWITIVSAKATPEQRYGIARDLKETLRARFDAEAWQQVAQPIFDTLRRRQRDALVAHIHSRGFARVEQLYEYFLIDPAMEPVVRTSRIRLATASVQLFIDRCLLNLERDVHPSTIDAEQWQWMKRYRVWEANRKIFLFPENWLEPEFRDDRTFLYTELEGSLLQGDVSRDHVNEAFFTYLRKLEEIARLEIVAMHCENNPNPALNKLHVIGRTWNATPKYFYRRYEHSMWTPWEPVTADVEGEHLAPIIWRDRLYLFWLSFIDRANPSLPTSTKKSSDLSLSEITTATSAANATKIMEAHLHWSEYLDGAWSARQSAYPAAGFQATVPMNFDRNKVFIHASLDSVPEDPGVMIHLTVFNRVYHLASPNALPEGGVLEAVPPMPFTTTAATANRYNGSGPLRVTLVTKITTEDGKAPVAQTQTLDILKKGSQFSILPCDNYLAVGTPEFSTLIAPVFYQDNTNTFFIEPSLTEKTIEEWQEWVVPPAKKKPEWEDPKWWDEDFVVPVVPLPRKPIPIDPGDPVWQTPFERGPLVNPARDWLVDERTVLDHEGVLIGPEGFRDVFKVSSRLDSGQAMVNVVGHGGLTTDFRVNLKRELGGIAGGGLIGLVQR